MNPQPCRIVLYLLVMFSAIASASAVAPAEKLVPGGTITIPFPDMPPSFSAQVQKQNIKPQITIFIPSNYQRDRKYPLLIFLNGADGGNGVNPGVARALCGGKDFICVGVPLFKATPAKGPSDLMTDEDAKYMWPYFRTMLTRLDEIVPNIDPAHQVLAGFSNGATATQGLIDQSDGEVARRFSAFFFVGGGGRLQRIDLLKGKAILMVGTFAKSRPRLQEICDTATAAGARASMIIEDTGKHEFPVSAYPSVGSWLRGPGLQ
jgi:predicted peptidase